MANVGITYFRILIGSSKTPMGLINMKSYQIKKNIGIIQNGFKW